MAENKIGKAISFLRKRAGYTQKDLADRIGISDKTVSKWERGLGLPDIGYLRKLSLLLDTDTDSLLSGDVVHHDSGWQGIIVLDENCYGIGTGTVIYDKPLIYYLLSYFLLVGIKNISITCTDADKAYLQNTLGAGNEYGINLSYSDDLQGVRISPDKSTMVVYGRCLLYGVDQTRFFQKAMMDKKRLTILALPKKCFTSDQILMDMNKKVVSSNNDEPINTQYDYFDIPILFCPPELLVSMLQSGDIKRFISAYSANNEMYVEILDRGFVEIEIDSWSNVQEASTFMKIVEDKCGMNVYCLEEVAWRRGMITAEQLRLHGEKHQGTEYGQYILSLYERINERKAEEVNGT